MDMILELLERIPGGWLIAAATALSAAAAIGLGRLLAKLRTGSGRKRALEPPAPAPVHAPEETARSREMEELAIALSASVDRLARAVACCTSAIDGIVQGEPASVQAARPFDRVEGSPGLAERIRFLRAEGLDEGTIARKLNVSSELLKLYLHAGDRAESKVS